MAVARLGAELHDNDQSTAIGASLNTFFRRVPSSAYVKEPIPGSRLLGQTDGGQARAFGRLRHGKGDPFIPFSTNGLLCLGKATKTLIGES